MGFWNRLFGKGKTKENGIQTTSSKKTATEVTVIQKEQWEELPFYISNDDGNNARVSIVATSIAANDQPESSFIVKKIMKKNQEAELVAVIAASIAAEMKPESEFVVKKIYQRK